MNFPTEMQVFLERCGMLQRNQPIDAVPLTGGVSSDIWRVTINGKSFCVKKALSKLKVKQNWKVSPARNRYEVDWILTAHQWVPNSVPTIISNDPETGLFVMEFLSELKFPVWKNLLSQGIIQMEIADLLGNILGTIHQRSANDKQLASQFATDQLFTSLRIEPYLMNTAKHHPQVATIIEGLAELLMQHKKSLVHGDVSPKNILVGIDGPVLIDAECAWYGDPAFDVAFLLNHFLLKCMWNPQHATGYLECASRLMQNYTLHVMWEPVELLEQRIAAILPALLLARIDGKSPVEYIQREEAKTLVRNFAIDLLLNPIDHVNAIIQKWSQAILTMRLSK